MKRILVLLTLFFTSIVYSQISHETILNVDYQKLPLKKRITNSGIYLVSHFEIKSNKVYIHGYDDQSLLIFNNNELEVVVSSKKLLKKEFNSPKLKIKNYSSTDYHYNIASGNFKNGEKKALNIVVKSGSELNISDKESIDAKLYFDNDLAYSNLVGIDKSGNLFLVVEKYIQQIPLEVSRHVYVISNKGEIKSILNLPLKKYLYTLTDLQIDEEGNLYHLLSDEIGIEIVKWEGLNEGEGRLVDYPSHYRSSVHFNDHTLTKEIETENVLRKITTSSRSEALRIGESYAYHKYYCSSSNLAPQDVTAKDGDIVRTPERLIEGLNARVPYKWGGFNTLAQFDQGLSDGKYAGDINTNGVSSEAVGVDCSGFVSRCWGLSYHASTSYMPNITNQYNNWSDLKPGDAVHKVGHVRLYISTNANGSIKTVESTSAHGWGVVYWSFAPSDLTNYTPRYYTGMENEYYENQPRINSVIKDDHKVEIKWTSNNADLLGYRVYTSIDRVNWNLWKDENELKETTAQDNIASGIQFYRVTSIKDNAPDYSESDFSNEMAVGIVDTSLNKYLIVDGFNRESGSWRGDGHKFVGRYGEALYYNNVSFESINSDELVSSSLEINFYDGVIWIAGDESTVDETFNGSEQQLIKNYLENGGNLFVSGSEIGWDLDYKGSALDREFYNNYLKASYKSDDASSSIVKGSEGSLFESSNFSIGQTYEEDYPDEIESFGGSEMCFEYYNRKGAGVVYNGKFGTSLLDGKLVYLAFPLETTANDLEFESVLTKVIEFFTDEIVSIEKNSDVITEYDLKQNYPNPFNPTTTIEFNILHTSSVQLNIYNVLGEKVRTLVDNVLPSGHHKVNFDASNLSSGIYYYQLQSGNFIKTRKMMLIK